ncbi:MAG: type II secretion system protein F, partial [SAR324 cluster bacterium]|nr:type II secretion system protein F [SAR324 cluster bacterium]
MPAYNYTAFDRIGKKQGGFISAASEREARRLIKNLNLIPIDVNQTAKAVANKIKVKSKTLVLATRQLATLLDSDIALDEAIKITGDHTNEKKLSKVLYELREEVI